MMVTTGARLHQVLRFFGELDVLRALLFVADLIGGSAEFARQFLGQLHIESLVDGGENLLGFDQLLDDEIRLYAQFFGKLLDRDAFGHRDLAIDGRQLHSHRPLGDTLAKIAFLFFAFAGALPSRRLGLMAPLLLGGQRRRRIRAAARSDAWAACRGGAVRARWGPPGIPGPRMSG